MVWVWLNAPNDPKKARWLLPEKAAIVIYRQTLISFYLPLSWELWFRKQAWGEWPIVYESNINKLLLPVLFIEKQ